MDYDDTLNRGLEESPDVQDGGSRFEVPAPLVRPDGTVTVYENFPETLDRLGRSEDHLLKFFQSELGTAVQVDDRGRPRFTGSFKQSRFARALEEYVDGHVRCSACGLPDTRLVTDEGVTVLKCDACGVRSPTP